MSSSSSNSDDAYSETRADTPQSTQHQCDLGCFKASAQSTLLCLCPEIVAGGQLYVFLAGLATTAVYAGLAFGAPSTSHTLLNLLGTAANLLLLSSFIGLMKAAKLEHDVLDWPAGSACIKSTVNFMSRCFKSESIQNNPWRLFSAGFSCTAIQFTFAWFVPAIPNVLTNIVGTLGALLSSTAFLGARSSAMPESRNDQSTDYAHF